MVCSRCGSKYAEPELPPTKIKQFDKDQVVARKKKRPSSLVEHQAAKVIELFSKGLTNIQIMEILNIPGVQVNEVISRSEERP